MKIFSLNQKIQKLLILKLEKLRNKNQIDYSKKKVRKEVLDKMRYKYLESVREYMEKNKN